MTPFQSRLSCLSTGGLLLWTAFCLVPSCAMAQQDSIVSFPLIPHHIQRARRSLRDKDLPRRSLRNERHLRRRTMAQPQQVGALFQGYGTHYVDLWVGSPPQRQTVIVDTGSGVTAFPCSDCKDCGAGEDHIDDAFDEIASETYQTTTCEDDTDCASYHASCLEGKCLISQHYAEGSRWDAVESIDSCYIGGPHDQPLVRKKAMSDAIDPEQASNFAFNVTFGCQYEVTGLFKTQLADGILGMDNSDEPYWKQLFHSGHLSPKNAFSLCYSRQPTTERDGTVAGALTFGGCQTELHNTDMVFVGGASAGRARKWSVTVRKLYLRDGSGGESVTPINEEAKQVEIDPGIVMEGILDSGTTDTHLPALIADDFKGAYESLTGSKYIVGEPLSITEAQVQLLPTVILQMVSTSDDNPEMDSFNTVGLAGNLDAENPHDVVIAIPPSHYMEYNDEDKTYTPAIHLDKQTVTVGANAMMGHDVLFDGSKNRIGWAESACNYRNLVEESGYSFSITGEMKGNKDGDKEVDCGINTTNIEVDGCIKATDMDVGSNATGVDISRDINGTDFGAGEGINANGTDVDIGVDTNATDTYFDLDTNPTDVDLNTNTTGIYVDSNASNTDMGANAINIDMGTNATNVDVGLDTNATQIDENTSVSGTEVDLDGANATEVDVDSNLNGTMMNEEGANVDTYLDETNHSDIGGTDTQMGVNFGAGTGVNNSFGQDDTLGTLSNATNTHVDVDSDADLEDEYEVLTEEEDVDEEEDTQANISFVPVDCHEEMIDRQSNITMQRLKNETAVAYCKTKNNVNQFRDLCDSQECQITVLVMLGVAIMFGMCACSCLKCLFYYLFCCCCCKKKDKGIEYHGLDTDEYGYSDDPALRPLGKKEFRDDMDS